MHRSKWTHKNTAAAAAGALGSLCGPEGVLVLLPGLWRGGLALPGLGALGIRGSLCQPGSLRAVCCRCIYILALVFFPSVVVPSAAAGCWLSRVS